MTSKHYFGAPLAWIEAHVAFAELVRRLERPRLVVDPPPYRPSPFLRGPEQLLIDFDGVRASHTLPRRPQAAVRASR